MSRFDSFDTFLLGGSREFDVETGDFSQLEIHQGGSQGFYYFYDKANRRLVTDFIIDDRPQVATICAVTLIYSGGRYSPRLKFWKKDKRKTASSAVMELDIPDLPHTRPVKALVDTSDGHKNLWKLIDWLQTCNDLSLPQEQFKIVTEDIDQLAEILKGNDKPTLVGMMSKVLDGNVTQADLDLIANRKGQLDTFERLIQDAEYFEHVRTRLNKRGREAVWQAFFDKNPWIFGYGLTLIPCQSYDPSRLERITTGANIFGGAGKRVDALLRTRGVVSSLVFCEIKHDETPLLAPDAYRPPDVYSPSEEIVGAVSQVQKTADKASRYLRDYLHQHTEPDGTRGGFEIATIRPKQIVVVGTTAMLESNGTLNTEMVASFELYRRSVNDVEILTFDELLARARFIVADS